MVKRQILENLGYRVTLCASSRECLEKFQEEPDQYDLVLTDQTMPDMTGIELAQEILNIQPDQPIILCTGYSRGVDSIKAHAVGIGGFIMKPMTRHEIAKLLREVLDAK